MVRAGLRTLALVAAVGVLVLAPGAALAASCQSLRAELARVSGGGRGGAQLAALERQAVANGCRGKAAWGRPRACAGIDAQISRLRGNSGNARRVRQLEAQIARACSSGSSRQANAPQAQRSPRVTQEIRAPESGVIIHGTRPDNRLDQRARGGGGFFASLFGGMNEPAPRRARPDLERFNPDDIRREHQTREPGSTGEGDGKRWLPGAPKGSNFKTWCVRLCDGYYFPIRENTNSGNFDTELAMCEQRCPGAEVSLYANKTYRQPESMVSAVTGEPYVDLPSAFAYRKAFHPACGCKPTTDIREAKVPDRLPGVEEREAVIETASGERMTDTFADAGAAPDESTADTGAGAEIASIATDEDAEAAAGGVTELVASEVDPNDATAERLQRIRARLTLHGDTVAGRPLAGRASTPDSAVGAADAARGDGADDVTLEEAVAIGNAPVGEAAPSSQPPLRVREVGPRFFAGPSTVVSLPAQDPAPVQ